MGECRIQLGIRINSGSGLFRGRGGCEGRFQNESIRCRLGFHFLFEATVATQKLEGIHFVLEEEHVGTNRTETHRIYFDTMVVDPSFLLVGSKPFPVSTCMTVNTHDYYKNINHDHTKS